ncbi:hypothetical protein IF1G_05677 [Cordyceps javanica]|uniref:Uncharacterized protein n=1 Tax=Cordyceps javanica TaxID=43265 RepID=A0A545V299_9HYPO|nr:hypothetical protein IF1G_05677 [Cordyceps javanica]TQW06956.1 hypothetical protein IF2G_05340 [Cordyceps javanica]
MAAEVSHGRGGAGNITADDTRYVDGEVVREGVIGSHGDGVYSAGRGGAGNIGDKGHPATERKDRDIIPDAAVRHSTDTGDYHTGRGGAGNEHTSGARAHHHHHLGHKDKDNENPGEGLAQEGGKDTGVGGEAPVGLADKLKHKLFAAFK